MAVWFLVFLLTPIIEMYLLIRVGGYIGAWPTIALVVLAAVGGVALVRRQGLATLTRGMQRLEGGQLPALEVIEGLLLAVAGVLLLIPGLLTDVLALVLLVPVLRRLLARRMLARAVVHPPPGARPGPPTQVIEGEFESRLEDDRRD